MCDQCFGLSTHTLTERDRQLTTLLLTPHPLISSPYTPPSRQEFLCVLVTYCIFNKDDILRFSFDCFDMDSSGKIDESELIALIRMLNEADPKYAGNYNVGELALFVLPFAASFDSVSFLH